MTTFSPDFTESWFTGHSLTSHVPAVLPIAIAGHPYRMDVDGYARETVDALRSAYDSLAEPGEHSLNTVGIWRRTQTHWEMGAGQTHWDEKDSDQFRFRTSKGVDPWTERTLRLQFDTTVSKTGAYADLKLLSVGTSWLYAVINQQLHWTTNPYAGSPTWTSSVIQNGEAAADCTSITTDGAAVYAALNANGIHKTTGGASSSSHFSAYTADLVGFANGHLLAADANALVEIDSVGASTPLMTHFSTGFSFATITPAPSGIFVGGNTADRGEFYFVGYNSSTAALAVPIPAGSLPRGEFIRDMKFYAGYLVLGTSKGFRLAEIFQDRGVSIAPLLPTTSPCLCVDVDGEYAWYGCTAFDSVSSGLYRARLSRFTEPLVPAFASDLMAGASTGATLSVARFQGKTCFAISGTGIYAQSTGLVASGTMDSGLVRWGTMEQKVTSSAGLKHDPLNGTVSIALLTEDGSSYLAGISNTAGSTGPTEEFSGGNTDGETIEVRLTLAYNSGDHTLGPVVRRWTIRAEVVPLLTDHITVPIVMKTSVLNMVGEGQPVIYDPLEEFLFLKSLEAARIPVVYQEGDLSQQVIVDKVLVKPEKWIEPTHHWFEGLVILHLLTVEPII